MLRAYKYRLYPNKAQAEFLQKSFGCVRWVYNWGLAKKIKHYEETGKTLSWFALDKELTQIKRTEEFGWLSEPYRGSLTHSLRNLENAYTMFFKKRTGFPNFKSKRRSLGAAVFRFNVEVDFSQSAVMIPKIGWIRISASREFRGEIKGGCVITQRPSGKYYVSVLVEDGKDAPKKKAIRLKTTVGIDLGIKTFAVMSNGETVENPKHLDLSLKRLRLRQRRLARRVKGSSRRTKAKKQVAICYERITNQRTDFLHKLSTRLIRENQTVAVEDLNVAGMVKNRNLARFISQAGWSEFVRQLQYKAEWHGKNVLQIGTFEPSSKTCSSCGLVNPNLTLADREWTCLCGITHDRDLNAAKNIKAFALRTVTETETNARGVLSNSGTSKREAALCGIGIHRTNATASQKTEAILRAYNLIS